jgi:hypothetical protein
MVRIRRFGVVRTATVFALWTLVTGLIIWIPISLIFLAVGDVTTTDQLGNEFTFSGGAGIVLGLVVIAIYAGFGWLFTAISLLIYNLVAGWVGGVEMELVNVVPQYVPPYQPAQAQYPQVPPQSSAPPPSYPAQGTPPQTPSQPPTDWPAAEPPAGDRG